MLPKHSLCVLSLSERQVLQFQWLRSGRCARCFCTSLRRRAGGEDGMEKGGNDAGTPFNAPRRGPTRHQRAALISKEVQMLQRDRPTPTFTNPDPDTLRPAGAGQTVDAEAVGRSVGPGRMGENDASTQDGPLANAQGATLRGGRSDVETGADTRAARSTGRPFTVEDSAERGGSGLERGLGESSGARLAPSTSEDDIPGSSSRKQVTLEPQSLSINELLQQCQTSTIAASTFQGTIDERLKTVTEPGTIPQEKSRRQYRLASKLMTGKLLRFESKEEQAAVLQLVKDIAKRRLRPSPKSKSRSTESSDNPLNPDSPENVPAAPRVYKFTPLPESVQNAMVDTMVKGTYDPAGVLDESPSGSENQRQSLINRITRATTMNGSYLSPDGERLLQKVKSLLPVQPTQARQQQRRSNE